MVVAAASQAVSSALLRKRSPVAEHGLPGAAVGPGKRAHPGAPPHLGPLARGKIQKAGIETRAGQPVGDERQTRIGLPLPQDQPGSPDLGRAEQRRRRPPGPEAPRAALALTNSPQT